MLRIFPEPRNSGHVILIRESGDCLRVVAIMVKCTFALGLWQGDFSFWFDTNRRRCYVAPERFYDAPGQAQGTPRGSRPYVLEPSMDIFSAGCVFAELFTDGATLFDLSQVPSCQTSSNTYYQSYACLRSC